MFLKQGRQYAPSFLFNAPLLPSAAAVTDILYLHTKPESRPDFEYKGILENAEWRGEHWSKVKRVDKGKLYANKIGKEVF